MDSPVIAPASGGGTLSPQQARRYFDFFRTGTHREVLLLGDLVEQHVHYVRSKGHKVLCGARGGACELCEKAALSDDVSDQQVEYYGPAYVRPWKEREFHQRVAVFSAAAGETVLSLLPDGSARGQRLDVARRTQGTSGRFEIRLLTGLPRGFPALIPAGFDIVPFVRARFGRRQDPARPLVFLAPFRCEAVVPGGHGRPKALDLSADDYRAAPEDIDRMRSVLAQGMSRLGGESTPAGAGRTPPAATAPAAKDGEPAAVGDALGDVLARFPVDATGLRYGPRHEVRAGQTPEAEAEAEAGHTAEIICAEVKAGLNGRHPAKKGGAK